MKIHSLYLALLGALCLCLPSCSNDDTLNGTTPDNNGEGVTATLTLTAKEVGSFVMSRWAPPQEGAVNKEAEIQDVLVIIYDKSFNDTGLADTDVPLQRVHLSVSKTSDSPLVYRTSQFTLDESVTAGNHYVFVVANPDATMLATGDGANSLMKANIKQMRDYVYEGPICSGASNVGDVSGFDRFVMSSDIERQFTVTDTDITDHGVVSLSKQTGGSETPIVVERLAARIDVSFGPKIVYGSGNTIVTEGSDYLDSSNNSVDITAASHADVAKIVLPVYDYDQYTKNSTLVRTYDTFTITGIKVLNSVTNKQLLVQKSNNVYFRDENWDLKGGTETIEGVITYPFRGYYAANTIAQASGVSKSDETGHTLGNLIVKGNNLYNASTVPYFTLGYYRENINNRVGNNAIDELEDVTDGKTTVVVTGTYFKYSDLDSGSHSYENMELTFVIRHCMPTDGTQPRWKGAMSYAIGRNTIYRLKIDKILRDSEYVNVIYYYDSNNDGEFNEYANSTPFGKYIIDSNEEPID